jgi:hypothetical protein
VPDTRVNLELEGIMHPSGMGSQEGQCHVSRVPGRVIIEACASHGQVLVRHVKACSRKPDFFARVFSPCLLACLPKTSRMSRGCLWLNWLNCLGTKWL